MQPQKVCKTGERTVKVKEFGIKGRRHRFIFGVMLREQKYKCRATKVSIDGAHISLQVRVSKGLFDCDAFLRIESLVKWREQALASVEGVCDHGGDSKDRNLEEKTNAKLKLHILITYQSLG